MITFKQLFTLSDVFSSSFGFLRTRKKIVFFENKIQQKPKEKADFTYNHQTAVSLLSTDKLAKLFITDYYLS